LLHLTQAKEEHLRGKEGGKKKTAAKTGISLPLSPLRFSSLGSLFPHPYLSPIAGFCFVGTRRLKEAIARAAWIALQGSEYIAEGDTSNYELCIMNYELKSS